MQWKIQKILEWIANADDDKMDALYLLLIHQDILYTEDIVGKAIYRQFLKDIEKNAIDEYLDKNKLK